MSCNLHTNFRAALAASLLCLLGMAEAPAARADEATARGHVLAQVSADLDGDGSKDRAVLAIGDDSDEVDLSIYLSGAGGTLPEKPTIFRKEFGWRGLMAGTKPKLSVSSAGSLVIGFANDSIGRDRWSKTYFVAFRGGQLVVAGFQGTAHDTLAGDRHSCDINFLSGKGMADGKPVEVGPPVPLASWTDEAQPKACAF